MPKTTQSSIWQNHKSLFFGHLFDFSFGLLVYSIFCCSKFSRRCQIFPFNCFCEPFVNLFLKDFTHSIFRKIPQILFLCRFKCYGTQGKNLHQSHFENLKTFLKNIFSPKFTFSKTYIWQNSHLWNSFFVHTFQTFYSTESWDTTVPKCAYLCSLFDG